MRLINIQPGRTGAGVSALIPFAVVLLLYAAFSNIRTSENPDDKLLPGGRAVSSAVTRMAFEPSRRTGEYLLWTDTAASLERLAIGIGVSAVLSLTVGILNGLIPWFAATWSPFVRVLSMIPPMAMLPILFIAFGLGELSKYVLIIIGTAPFLMREIEQRVRELPHEQLIKAQTLDATSWQIVLRVVLPQILPRLVDAVRLSLGAAWLFLIAAEAIAATEGLGYRIFLVRRYLSMDVILPYVCWITALAFLFDFGLKALNKKLFPWYGRNT